VTNAPIRARRPPKALVRFAAAGVGGALLALSDDTCRGRALLRLLGLGLIGYAAQPIVEDRLRRVGERRRSIAYQTLIDIERPVTDVFTFFKDFENFPRVIGGLESVIDYQDGRSRWQIFTPSGRTLSWDAVVTKYVPNGVIAWESVPGSAVETAGLVRFTALSPRWTRLELSMTYRPAYTGLDDAVRTLFGPRAARRLRDDLDHARFYLESLPLTTDPAPV
jgi:uncharacterized membrane protein